MRLKYEENHHSEQENTIYTTSASSPVFSVSPSYVYLHWRHQRLQSCAHHCFTKWRPPYRHGDHMTWTLPCIRVHAPLRNLLMVQIELLRVLVQHSCPGAGCTTQWCYMATSSLLTLASLRPFPSRPTMPLSLQWEGSRRAPFPEPLTNLPSLQLTDGVGAHTVCLGRVEWDPDRQGHPGPPCPLLWLTWCLAQHLWVRWTLTCWL